MLKLSHAYTAEGNDSEARRLLSLAAFYLSTRRMMLTGETQRHIYRRTL